MRSIKPNNKTRKEKKRFQKKVLIISLLLIFIIFDWFWILNHSFFKVKEIEIEGQKTLLEKDINYSIRSYLDEKFLFFLPKSNILFTNTKSIEKRIKKDFPKVYSANISIQEGKKISIDIEEREPHSLWCKDLEYENVFDEECYFADQKGFIYTQAPYFSEGVFEKMYIVPDLLYIGAELSTKDDFKKFFEFTSFLKEEYNIGISKVFVDYDGDILLYMDSFQDISFTENSPYIVYKHENPFELIKRNLHLMVNNKDFKKDFKKDAKKLEYIDLRIQDQIRYKFFVEEEKQEEKDEKNNQEN